MDGRTRQSKAGYVMTSGKEKGHKEEQEEQVEEDLARK